MHNYNNFSRTNRISRWLKKENSSEDPKSHNQKKKKKKKRKKNVMRKDFWRVTPSKWQRSQNTGVPISKDMSCIREQKDCEDGNKCQYLYFFYKSGNKHCNQTYFHSF
jgi:hypothetical protein